MARKKKSPLAQNIEVELALVIPDPSFAQDPQHMPIMYTVRMTTRIEPSTKREMLKYGK